MGLLATLDHVSHGGNLQPTALSEYHTRGMLLAVQFTTFELHYDRQHPTGTDEYLASLM